MSMSFNPHSIFNLIPIPPEEISREVLCLLLPEEKTLFAFQSIRDQIIFTDRRIISVDVQGLTGKRKAYTTMPYSRIRFHSIRFSGLPERASDSELDLVFTDGTQASFEFNGNVDIVRIDQLIFSKELE